MRRSILRIGWCGSVGTGSRSSSHRFGWTGNKDHDADRESRPVGSSAPGHPAERNHHDRIPHIVGGGTVMPAHPELDLVAERPAPAMTQREGATDHAHTRPTARSD